MDAVIGGVFLFCGFQGARKGLVAEFLKVVMTLVMSILILHFYGDGARLFEKFGSAASGYHAIAAFLGLWGALWFVFKIVHDALMSLSSEEKVSRSARFTGGVVSLARAPLIAGLLVIGVMVMNHDVGWRWLERSRLSAVIARIPYRVYQAAYSYGIVRAFPRSDANMALEETMARTEDVWGARRK